MVGARPGAGRPETTVVTDVCIIGGGVVGLFLAQLLADAGRTVLVLEAGRGRFDPDEQAGGIGNLAGPQRYGPLVVTRARALGGTAHLWREGHFQVRRLEPRDLAPQAVRGGRGWPIGTPELASHYARVEAWCRVYQGWEARGSIDDLLRASLPARWREGLGDDLRTVGFQYVPAPMFTRLLPRQLERNPRVTIRPGAVTAVLETSGGEARVVRAVRNDGGWLGVQATQVVVAAGGIENARLLLANELGGPKVGQGFMEHALVPGQLLEIDPAVRPSLTALDLHRRGPVLARGGLDLSPSLQAAEGLAGLCTVIGPRASNRRLEALRAAARLRDRDARPGDVRRILAGPDHLLHAAVMRRVTGRSPSMDVQDHGWTATRSRRQRRALLQLWHYAEHLPDDDNRVTLSEQRDHHGLPVADLRFTWGAGTGASVRRGIEALVTRLEAAGLARVHPSGDDEENEPVWGLHHHLGTTRMGTDPAMSVVDADLRVHGLTNVSVVGTSVFPTGGYANPTLTALALASRLAGRLTEG